VLAGVDSGKAIPVEEGGGNCLLSSGPAWAPLIFAGPPLHSKFVVVMSRKIIVEVMSLQEIEQSALKLTETERAKLAAQLLHSLPPVLAEDDDGVAEALRRDAELDHDPNKEMTLNDLDARIEQRRRSR
jgi:hypothetical protein